MLCGKRTADIAFLCFLVVLCDNLNASAFGSRAHHVNSHLPSSFGNPPSLSQEEGKQDHSMESICKRRLDLSILRRQQRRSLSNSHYSSLGLSTRGGDTADNEKGVQAVLAGINQFRKKNSFLIGMFAAVGLARLFPSVGKTGGILRPELFIGQFGVTFIFLISGLSLEFSELSDASSRHLLNASILLATFLAWPYLVGVPLTRAIAHFSPNLLTSPLLDGLLILTCLPTTANMNIILTSTAGGNVACALWNTVVSNLAGIFLTPALLFRFFGAQIRLPFLDMVVKLCNKVLLPVVIGQSLRQTKVKDFYVKHKKKFKTAQEVTLLAICWNAFCNTFSSGIGLELRHALAMFAIIPMLILGSLGALFQFFSSAPFLKLSRADVVAATFCSSHKTLAFGLPLINTIFEGNPNLASYCTPLMFIHPLQLILGSLFLPSLETYIEEEDKQS